jgi:hypothetical protein
VAEEIEWESGAAMTYEEAKAINRRLNSGVDAAQKAARGKSPDWQAGYVKGYEAGLEHGGDDGLEIAIPLTWNAAIDAAAELYERAFNRAGDATATAIRKLRR